MRSEKENNETKEKIEKAEILDKIEVSSYDISCNMDDQYIDCYNKNITIRIKNKSDKDIGGLTISYEIGENIDCSGSLGKSFTNYMKIPAGGTGSIVHNVKFADAGPDGIMSGCVRVSGIGSVDGQAGPWERY